MKELDPEVYIIESLRFHEEDTHREGEVIAHILHATGKETYYRYVRTKQELEDFVQDFLDHQCRYLHLSMHGDPSGFEMTLDRTWLNL